MRVARALLVVLCSVVLCSTACAEYFEDTKDSTPGESVGAYALSADADMTSSCTEILNASPRPWTFSVSLRRDGTKGYWLSGPEPIEGTIDATGKLSFKQTLSVPVRGVDKVNGYGACTIVRVDEFAGKLAGAPTTDAGVQTFTGTLRYSYQIAPGSDCRDVVGAPTEERKSPMFATMPCDARFAVTATRTGAARTLK